MVRLCVGWRRCLTKCDGGERERERERERLLPCEWAAGDWKVVLESCGGGRNRRGSQERERRKKFREMSIAYVFSIL